MIARIGDKDDDIAPAIFIPISPNGDSRRAGELHIVFPHKTVGTASIPSSS